MSLSNVLIRSSDIHFAVDSIGYDRDGVVREFVNKTVLLPHLRAVVLVQGATAHIYKITQLFNRYRSTGEMLDRLCGDLKSMRFLNLVAGDFNATILSVSDEKPRAWFISSSKKHFIKHWTLAEIPYGNLAPRIGNDETDLGQLDNWDRAARSGNYLTVLQTIREQRLQKHAIGRSLHHTVGGSIFYGTMSTNRMDIRMFELHRFPDEIGKPVNPAYDNEISNVVDPARGGVIMPERA